MSPELFRGVQRRTMSPSCVGRSSGLPLADKAGATISMLRHKRERSAFPTSNAMGVRQSRALFHLRAAHRAIGGNIKPDIGAIHEEELLLGRFVIPTHAPRSGKIDSTRFGLNGAFAIGIALKESGFSVWACWYRDSRARARRTLRQRQNSMRSGRIATTQEIRERHTVSLTRKRESRRRKWWFTVY